MDKILPMWLRHSRALPLDIHLFWNTSWKVSGWRVEKNRGALHLMATHMHRLTSLSLLMAHWLWLLPAGICLEAPVLRMFQLRNFWSGFGVDSSALGEFCTPALTDLYVAGIPFKWLDVVKHTPQQLCRFHGPDYDMLVGELVSFLNQHPNLDFFIVMLKEVPRNVPQNLPQPSLVYHTCLKSLVISYSYNSAIELDDILLNLQTPNFKSLEPIVMNYGDLLITPSCNPLLQILHWINSLLQVSLQYLVIQLPSVIHSMANDFCEIIGLVSLLETLHIRGKGQMCMDGEFLAIFNHADQPAILLSLVSLTFKGMYVSPSSLYTMLQSCLSSCNKLDSLVKLKEFEGKDLILEPRYRSTPFFYWTRRALRC